MAVDPAGEGRYDPAGPGRSDLGPRHDGPDRRTDETKAAPKTTEFIAYLLVTIAILIVGVVIGEEDNGGADDFAANTVWLYVTILTFGYMISRGIAKSGSRHRYWDDDNRR